MKTYSFIIVVFTALLMPSCASKILEEEIPNTNVEGKTKDLSIVIDESQFSVSNEEMGRANSSVNYLDFVGVYLYTEDNSVYTLYKSCVPTKTADVFPEIKITGIAYGTYTMVVLGIKGSEYPTDKNIANPTNVIFTDGTNTDLRPKTFLYKGSLTVNDETTSQKMVTLDPVLTQFEVVMTGEIPTTVDAIRLTVENTPSALNCITGFSTGENKTFTIHESVSSSHGKSNKSISFYNFIKAESISAETSDIRITMEAMGNDGEPIAKYKKVFDKVPFSYKKKTKYTGNFFETDMSFSIEVNATTLGTAFNETY